MSRQSEMDTYSQAGEWLMGTARRNPEALLLLAAGCALLMRSKSDSRRTSTPSSYGEDKRSSFSSMKAPGREGFTGTTQKAADYAANMKDRVAETASEYADTVSDFADDARRTVTEISERFARQAQTTMQNTMDRVLRNQPLAVAAAGLAAGALVAAAFPSTDMEKRALGGAHEALTDAADKATKTVVSAASKAGERLMSAAEERGLTSQGLRDVAGEVADTFTEAVGTKSGADQRTRMVPDSPATADFGMSELGSEKRNPGRESQAQTAGPGSGNKR